MFELKSCEYCGKSLEKDWKFCPYCGKNNRKEYREHSDISEDVEKAFGPRFFKFPKIELRSPFRNSGVSITIKTSKGMKPQIDMKTPEKYKELESKIKRRVGVKRGIEEIKERKSKRRKPPKVTEEPETKIKREKNRMEIEIKFPDVKDSEDIEIRKLKQSLEIKAFTGDKAYFKLIPIKPTAQISGKNFKSGILEIELIE